MSTTCSVESRPLIRIAALDRSSRATSSGAEGLGGQNDNGDPAPDRVVLDDIEERESVHDGHHEVEHDHRRHELGKAVKALAAVAGGADVQTVLGEYVGESLTASASSSTTRVAGHRRRPEELAEGTPPGPGLGPAWPGSEEPRTEARDSSLVTETTRTGTAARSGQPGASGGPRSRPCPAS